MHTKKLIVTALLFSWVIVSGCSYTSVRQHQDFDEYLADIKSVVIAPPAVTIEEWQFSGDKVPLLEKKEKIRELIMLRAKERLLAKGFEVKDFDFNAAMESDPDFAFEVNQVVEAFNEARAELYDGKPVTEENKDKFDASIGPVINPIASRSQADAVLLLHYYGYEKSAGMVAKDLAASVLLALVSGGTTVAQSMSGSQVEIAFIDGDTGAVLWVNTKAVPSLTAEIAKHTIDEFPDTEHENGIRVVKRETAPKQTESDYNY